LQPGA
jgi:hypothetical protein